MPWKSRFLSSLVSSHHLRTSSALLQCVIFVIVVWAQAHSLCRRVWVEWVEGEACSLPFTGARRDSDIRECGSHFLVLCSAHLWSSNCAFLTCLQFIRPASPLTFVLVHYDSHLFPKDGRVQDQSPPGGHSRRCFHVSLFQL